MEPVKDSDGLFWLLVEGEVPQDEYFVPALYDAVPARYEPFTHFFYIGPRPIAVLDDVSVTEMVITGEEFSHYIYPSPELF